MDNPTRISAMPLPRHLAPRKQPKQERSRDLVEAVVEAAARILVEQGFDDFAMADVATRAGVSAGSLYQYFPHKESLVVAVLERQATREAAFLAERFACIEANGVGDLLRQAVRAVLDFRALDRALFERLLAVIPHVGRYYDLRARGQDTALRLRAMLEPFVGSTPGGPTLDELVFVIANATHALTHEGLLPRPTTLSDERLADEIARLLLGYLDSLARP
jgi:AcrR family transcriptional regulator